jgi:hypothetical protein
MGLYEKFLGFGIVPFLFLFLVILSTGLLRRHMHFILKILLSINVKINDRTIYFFPFIAFLNLLYVFFYYNELQKMHEPEEQMAKTKYFEELYRIYRNFLLNIASAIMIFQIFYSGKKYQEYRLVKEKLAALEKKK